MYHQFCDSGRNVHLIITFPMSSLFLGTHFPKLLKYADLQYQTTMYYVVHDDLIS